MTVYLCGKCRDTGFSLRTDNFYCDCGFGNMMRTLVNTTMKLQNQISELLKAKVGAE